jgi:hypothetical protein
MVTNPIHAVQYPLTFDRSRNRSSLAAPKILPSGPEISRASRAYRLAPLPTLPNWQTCQTGGGGRDRTDDLKLAKLALSQLSYAPSFDGLWWAREDLNLRPHAYQACALTN